MLHRAKQSGHDEATHKADCNMSDIHSPRALQINHLVFISLLIAHYIRAGVFYLMQGYRTL